MKKTMTFVVVALFVAAVGVACSKKKPDTMPADNKAETGGAEGGDAYGGAAYGGNPCAGAANPCGG
jgi:hypothetical protein